MLSITNSILASTFTAYQAFVQPGATVETLIDKSLIVEMIVRCPDGAGILTYSKFEKRYCTPDFTCYRSIGPAIAHLCN